MHGNPPQNILINRLLLIMSNMPQSQLLSLEDSEDTRLIEWLRKKYIISLIFLTKINKLTINIY